MTKTTPAPTATDVAHLCVPAFSLLLSQVVFFAGAFTAVIVSVKRSKNKAHT